MATERVSRGDRIGTASPDAVRDDRRGYRIGPEDMEDFVNLSAEEQRRLADTPVALAGWLAERAAKYAQDLRREDTLKAWRYNVICLHGGKGTYASQPEPHSA